MYCFDCKYWKRHKGTNWGSCKLYDNGKMKKFISIIVAGGYSAPDNFSTMSKFSCTLFKKK